jgi:N-acetylmuramoyl-L-alanine amidase
MYRRRSFTLAALVVLLIGVGAVSLVGYLESVHRDTRAQRDADLRCLAENVYYESRGEPLAGQFAVAEVTLNRVASRLFPPTVCEVVYEKHWDSIRERYIGAFSWTVLDSLPEPTGLAWQRAVAIAGSAYDNQEAPLVEGALFYHATYVSPGWSNARTRVARISGHLFYE